jgi:hypothetical protein
MGVVSYFLVPVVRDLLSVAGFTLIAASLDQTLPRLSVSLLLLWLAWLLNLLGIRDEALIAALKTGRIAAAGLEVYESEPTFTPHIARCQTRFCYRIWERPRLRQKPRRMILSELVSYLFSPQKPLSKAAVRCNAVPHSGFNSATM